MVSILDFDSKSGGSNPPASANMRSYTVDSSGAGYKLTAFELEWFNPALAHHLIYACVAKLVNA